MTAWVLYVAAVSALFGAAARAAESALSLYGRPVRLVWLVALLGSLAVPVAFGLGLAGGPARVAGESGAPLEVMELDGVVVDGAAPSLLDRLRPPPALDRAVGVAWLGSAGAALLALALWFGAVAMAPRRWPRTRVEDEDVRVAPAAGPAVFGLLRPSIVVPRWLLDCPADVRRLALLHEREHVAARDPALLALGATLAAVTPWNPVSWWLLFRLRAAVELDCDRRVLRRGTSVHAYGAMLLGVAGRTMSPRPALALVEPAELLERRIRAMTDGKSSWRSARGLACGAACLAALLVACTMDGPTSPEPADEPVELRASAEGAAKFTHDDEMAGRVRRLVARLGAQLGNDGREAGTATFEILVPMREGAVDETQAVIRRILEVQAAERTRLEREASADTLVMVQKALGDAQGQLGRVRVRGLDKRKAELTAAEEAQLPAKVSGVLRARPKISWADEPLLFIDGVKATRAEMDALVPDRIERVEVIKGAAALKYGPEGGRGVVQIFTKKR